jgi:hypothetical protein
MIVVAYLNKFDKKVGSPWTLDSSAGRDQRLSHDLKIKQGWPHWDCSRELRWKKAGICTGQLDLDLQERGTGWCDCSTGRE